MAKGYRVDEEFEDLGEAQGTPQGHSKGKRKRRQRSDVPRNLVANVHWGHGKGVANFFATLQLFCCAAFVAFSVMRFLQAEVFIPTEVVFIVIGCSLFLCSIVIIIGTTADHLSSFIFVEEVSVTMLFIATFVGVSSWAYTLTPAIESEIFSIEMALISPDQLCGKDWEYCLSAAGCPGSVQGCYGAFNSTLRLGFNVTLPYFLNVRAILPEGTLLLLLLGACILQLFSATSIAYVKGLSCVRRSKDKLRVRYSLDHNQVVVPMKWRKMVIDEIRAMIAEVGISVKDIFETFDKDRNGTLSIAEFKNAIQQMNLPLEKRHIVELYRSIDVNHTGGISYTEFCDKLLPENWQEEILQTIKNTIDRYGMSLKEAFVALADGKRHIPVPRFRQILHEMKTGLSPYHVNLLVKKIDTDGNDYISVDEFLDIFLHQEWKRDVVDAFRRRMADKGASALEVFSSFDVDGNGTISRDEFRHAMDRLGIDLSKRHYDTLLEDIDSDGDGVISYEEFVAAFAPQASQSRIQSFDQLVRALRDLMVEESVTVQDAFDVFDKDNDGSISRDEFRRAIGRLLFDKLVPPSLVDLLMEQMDTDQDDRVSFEEFREYMKNSLGTRGSHLLGAQHRQIWHTESPATPPISVNGESDIQQASANLDHALSMEAVRDESRGMSATLSSNIEALYNAFAAQDRTGSGLVSSKDFKVVISQMRLGFSPHQMEALLSYAVEKAASGSFIDYKKFCSRFRVKRKAPIPPGEARPPNVPLSP